MKNILLIILTLIVNISFAQTEKTENKIVAEKFVKNYNNNDYEAIFSMFAEVMQNALPIDKTTEFLSGLKAQAGNITNREFVKYENGSFASYKTIFERAVFSLNISVDNNSKINGLLVKPFVEENNSENVINNLSKNELITKEQSEIIFNKVKSFPNNTQISIAIIRNGKVSYYGVKQNNDTILSIENYRSIFEIGSISKIFTSTLLAGFITDKKIKLNDNINGFLNLAFKNGIKISFKELANHTSGLPALPTNLDLTAVNPENPYKEYNKTYLDEYLTKNIELSNKGMYQYSNLGAGLLGYVLSKISNVSYDSLLYSKIFSKYNMLNSTTSFNKIKGNLIKGLDNKGNEVSNWEFSVLAGAGGILSNVEDLAKFAIAQFDCSNKELKLTRKKTFEVNKNMDIGLGWHILKSQSENVWNWHNGGTGGYSSSMVIDTKNKNGIVILSNVSAFNPNMKNIEKLCFELMKTLEKK
jgi:CubicO group peptidase (beta-lactamase class C family)